MTKISLDELLQLSPITFSGKVIAFCTDTVWGIGVMVDSNIQSGLSKIYQMKKRDQNKPLAVLAHSFDEVKMHLEYNQLAIKLTTYWPGALTIIFKKKDDYFDQITQLSTIGIRVPNSVVALTVLKHLGPMATTSINISGEAPINAINDIMNQFGHLIDYLVTDTNPLSKVSSTVVDATTNELKVLRQGDIKIN